MSNEGESYLDDATAASETDQGVPVGAADARADRGDADTDTGILGDDEEYHQKSSVDEATDQGVPVGAADAEQDRLNASEDDRS